MHWNSFEEFIGMGGYGLYVWGAYALTFAVMAAESRSVRLRLRRALAPERGEDSA